MQLDDAIAFIREWREAEDLLPLSFSELVNQAEKYLFVKGYNLPSELNFNNENYILNEGVYMNILDKSKEETDDLYPYNPLDKRTFYSDTYKCKVLLTGDLKISGTYMVSKLGEGYQVYPDLARNLKPVVGEESEILPTTHLSINKSNWSDIKNWTLDKFVSSYPWQRAQDKSSTQVKEDIENFIKSKNKGLITLILNERINGVFVNREEFINRMNNVYDSFPWNDFCEVLDFNY